MFLVLVVVNHFAPIKYLRSWYHSFSFRSLSLARSLSCSVPGCHSFARVACEDRETERQRDRDRRSSSFCFYAPNLKCQPRWEVYQKIKRENNKHKQQDKKKQKGEILLVEEREREIYKARLFQDFFDEPTKKRKSKTRRKISRRSFGGEIYSPPLFERPTKSKRTQSVCDDTL